MALKALRAIEDRDAFANQALDAALKRSSLAGPDRALATELVYGVTRRCNTLDWAIAQVSSRPLAAMDGWTRNILRLGVYQLLFLDRVPDAAAVHESVELAKRYGHAGTAGFVNGVLRGVIRRRDEILDLSGVAGAAERFALRHSQPLWIAERWLNRFGPEEAAELCASCNQTPPLTVRANLLRTTRSALQERLRGEGIEAEPARHHPQALELRGFPPIERIAAFREGLFSVQDEGSMLTASALGPRPGDTVIDACAGRGGKSTHLAELMGNRGRVVACDVHEHKLRQAREAARRLGVDIIAPLVLDARRLGELMPEGADRVLVDAPCSGLGALRRRPDLRWRKRPPQLEDLRRLQLAILRGAAACVKPGGALVYATCSTEPEENQELVEAFLDGAPDFSLDPLWPHLPVGLWKEPGVDEGWLQLLPHRHGTDGFFIARLARAGG